MREREREGGRVRVGVGVGVCLRERERERERELVATLPDAGFLKVSARTSFNVCCYGPRFTCVQKYGDGQGMHQSDLGADGDVLVVPDDF